MKIRELSFSQRTAMRLMREKLNAALVNAKQAQADYQQLATELASEIGIPKAELAKWQFDETEMMFKQKGE